MDFSRTGDIQSRLRSMLLSKLQDLLGDLHDLQVLASRVRDCEAGSRAAGTRRQLRALADELDDRVRHLHSRYLGDRKTLVPVVGRARRMAATLTSTGGEHGEDVRSKKQEASSKQ
jgi:hypothetical protein